MSDILTLKFVYFSISLYRGFLFKEIDLVQNGQDHSAFLMNGFNKHLFTLNVLFSYMIFFSSVFTTN